MSKSPLVSVIIPNYNHAMYLDQRIQSVLNQTYRNIEVIILDDKSSDNSVSVIREYATRDNRIAKVVVNEVNSGNTFLQWQKGISLASGEIIWIAESDDYCELNMLEVLLAAYYKRKNTVLAYTTVTLVDENGNKSWYKASPDRYMPGCRFLKHYLSTGNTVKNASAAIFSKDAALQMSKDYMTFQGAGDYLFWVQIAALGNVAVVNKNLSYFRRHTGVVTSRMDANGTNLLAEKKILEKIKQFVKLTNYRKCLIYANRARRICGIQFVSDEVRENIETVWEYDKFSRPVFQLLWTVAINLRVRFGIWL